MNLDEEQSRQVVSLRPGVAAVFADGMDRPLRIQVPYGGGRERAVADPANQAHPAHPATRPSAAAGRRPAGRPARPAGVHSAGDPPGRHAGELARRRLAAGMAEALVLAHLTNRPLPGCQPGCAIAGLTSTPGSASAAGHGAGAALDGRATAVRASYDPARFAASCAATARRLLDGGKGAGTPPGRLGDPQLQWLHEIERACPLNGPAPDPFAPAPRLEFVLLAWPTGRREDRQRVSGLRRHPLSMELARNRLPAWTVVMGEDDQRGFIDDLAAVAIGVSHRGQLSKAAGEMGIAGWLEPVLSWPAPLSSAQTISSWPRRARASPRGR